MMEGTRWRRLRDVYERALDLSPQQRAAFLDDSCAGDLDLRSDIEAMLAHEEAGESFLEPPAKKILSQPGEPNRRGRPVAGVRQLHPLTTPAEAQLGRPKCPGRAPDTSERKTAPLT